MTLPAKLQKGSFKTRNYKQRSKTSSVASPTLSSSSVSPKNDAGSTVSDVFSKLRRPFLKGSIPHSLFIDISNVDDQKSFLVDFNASCEGGVHLWSVSDTLRRHLSHIYAEVCVSPSKRAELLEKGLKLDSLTSPLAVFPSLSMSAEILKVSLSGLPAQYGRADGGLAQLNADMYRNLSIFGNIVDCGIVVNSSGFFSGNGFVVLECLSSSNSDAILDHESSDSTKVPKLAQQVDWSFHSIVYSSPVSQSPVVDDTLASELTHIKVRATWISMPAFCRYCRSPDHTLIDCTLRPRKTA